MDTIARWLYRMAFFISLAMLIGLGADLASAENALQQTGACMTAMAFAVIPFVMASAFDRWRLL